MIDMKKLNKIAKGFGLLVFEDSAPAIGSRCDNRKAGSLSIVAAFSFRTGHPVSGIEICALLADNEILWNTAKSLKELHSKSYSRFFN